MCYWQDATPGQESHNPCALWRAQQNFELFLASHHRWLDHTRNPLPDESRATPWQATGPLPLMRAEREAVIDLITDAFRNVTRGDGVSLREADVIDSHGGDWEREQARSLDTDSRWQEVREEDLERFRDALSFLDPAGFRYYLPAYMAWDLRQFRAPDSWPKSFLLFHLVSPTSDYHSARHLWGLDHLQSHAVHRYLRFIADYGDESSANDARRGLKKYWRRYSQSSP